MSSDDDESRVVDASLETVEWSAVHSWVAELHDDAINHIYASRLALQRMLDDGCADLRSIDAAIDQLDRAVEALQSAGMLLATDPYGLADASGPLAT